MRYARCKFSSSLVHKKNFRFIWQVVFKSGDVKRGRIPLLSLNELWEKSQATTILGKFVKSHNQTLIGLQFSGNAFHWSKFKPLSHDISYSFLELLIFFRDFVLINSSTYLLLGVYFSLHHWNIISEYKLQQKPIMKWKQAFSLVSFME